MLGLHERGIPYTDVTVPPLSVFVHSGFLMPAAKIDGGPWMLDSERILVELGFTPVEAETKAAVVRLFLACARFRALDGLGFWRRFSIVRDGHPSGPRRHWNGFWRAFLTFYFFVLVSLAARLGTLEHREELVRRLSRWDQRCGESAPFLGGDAPDLLDLQLFGLVQMCGSVPGEPLDVIREAPELDRLRSWIARMQKRFSDHPHLYSAPFFEPRLPPMGEAPASERFVFWLGAFSAWLVLPLSLAMTIFSAYRARKTGYALG